MISSLKALKCKGFSQKSLIHFLSHTYAFKQLLLSTEVSPSQTEAICSYREFQQSPNKASIYKIDKYWLQNWSQRRNWDRGYIIGCSRQPASIISMEALLIWSHFLSHQQWLDINCKYDCHTLEILLFKVSFMRSVFLTCVRKKSNGSFDVKALQWHFTLWVWHLKSLSLWQRHAAVVLCIALHSLCWGAKCVSQC